MPQLLRNFDLKVELNLHHFKVKFESTVKINLRTAYVRSFAKKHCFSTPVTIELLNELECVC